MVAFTGPGKLKEETDAQTRALLDACRSNLFRLNEEIDEGPKSHSDGPFRDSMG
jgi:hypothetical protein